MGRIWIWVCLAFLFAVILTQLSSENTGRYWVYVGIETAGLLACIAAIF
jgi:hypothetical protein